MMTAEEQQHYASLANAAENRRLEAEVERLTAQNKNLRDAMLECSRIFETVARAALEPKP